MKTVFCEEKPTRLCEAALCIANLAAKLGVKSIKDMDKPWVHKVNKKWVVACNGTKKNQTLVDYQKRWQVHLDPYDFAVWREGEPVAIFNSFGQGSFNSGSIEDEFCDEMRKIIKNL